MASASGAEEYDGHIVAYGAAGSGRSIEIVADSGTGIISPAHGMASTVVYGGGPQQCRDADHAPILDQLFQLEDPGDLQRELRRIAELAGAPEELVWLVCTMVLDGDRNAPLAEEDWRYIALWADGGWLYSVRGSTAKDRETAIATLVGVVDAAASAPDSPAS